MMLDRRHGERTQRDAWNADRGRWHLAIALSAIMAALFAVTMAMALNPLQIGAV